MRRTTETHAAARPPCVAVVTTGGFVPPHDLSCPGADVGHAARLISPLTGATEGTAPGVRRPRVLVGSLQVSVLPVLLGGLRHVGHVASGALESSTCTQPRNGPSLA